MKIDMFPHIVTPGYLELLRKKVRPGFDLSEISDWALRGDALTDLEIRLRLMDRYPEVVHVLTMGTPPLETALTPEDAPEVARIGNDELAELVRRYPDRFVAAVACLPLNNIEASLEEIDRAMTKLDMRGIQMFTNMDGEPLTSAKFRPIFEKMVQYDLPIWIHPWFPKERVCVQPFGWPIETSQTMIELVASGILTDYPTLKFIVHHCGGMVSFLSQRIRSSWRFMIKGKKPVGDPLDHLKKFYADTAVYGNTGALTCGHAFFGADHLLFGTDMPLGTGRAGTGFTRATIRSIEEMQVSEDDKEKIFAENAVRILRLTL